VSSVSNPIARDAVETLLEALKQWPTDLFALKRAQHCLANTLYFGGRHEEGAAFIETHARDWDGCMSFMYTHNYFHLANAHLALGLLLDSTALG
jgi:hypothetical protein